MGNFATGLLGAIAGGAKAYGDVMDQRMEDESQMNKLRSIEEFKAEMEQKREARLEAQKEERRAKVSGQMKGYLKAEDDKMFEQAATSDAGIPSEYDRHIAAQKSAILDANTEAAGGLGLLAGKSPEEQRKAELDEQKTMAGIKRDEASANRDSYQTVADGGQLFKDGKRIADNQRDHAPRSGGGGDGGGKMTAAQKEAESAVRKLHNLRVVDGKGNNRPMTREEVGVLAEWTNKLSRPGDDSDREAGNAPKWVTGLINQSGGAAALKDLFKAASLSDKQAYNQSGSKPEVQNQPKMDSATQQRASSIAASVRSAKDKQAAEKGISELIRMVGPSEAKRILNGR